MKPKSYKHIDTHFLQLTWQPTSLWLEWWCLLPISTIFTKPEMSNTSLLQSRLGMDYFFSFPNFFFLDCVVALSESRKYQTKTMEVCSRDGRWPKILPRQAHVRLWANAYRIVDPLSIQIIFMTTLHCWEFLLVKTDSRPIRTSTSNKEASDRV